MRNSRKEAVVLTKIKNHIFVENRSSISMWLNDSGKNRVEYLYNFYCQGMY